MQHPINGNLCPSPVIREEQVIFPSEVFKTSSLAPLLFRRDQCSLIQQFLLPFFSVFREPPVDTQLPQRLQMICPGFPRFRVPFFVSLLCALQPPFHEESPFPAFVLSLSTFAVRATFSAASSKCRATCFPHVLLPHPMFLQKLHHQYLKMLISDAFNSIHVQLLPSSRFFFLA